MPLFIKRRMNETGGLIAAAGRSSRMGALKPLLPLGKENLLRQGIITMKKAGADPAVVVTGREADRVEAGIADLEIRTVRNESFEKTQMLDSIKLGLAELKGKCRKVLFAPADAPLYSLETVQKLLSSDAGICVPSYQGETGHPVYFDADLIDGILEYEGPGGLAGALDFLGTVTLIECNDPGAYMDADTPDDYNKMLEYYESTFSGTAR